MFQRLLKWLGPWLLKQLVPVLDPDAAERAKALDAKITALEEREREAAVLQQKSDEAYAASLAQYEASQQRRAELQTQHEELLRQIAADEEAIRQSDARREEIRHEAEQAKLAIDNATDDDILSGALPGAKPGSGN